MAKKLLIELIKVCIKSDTKKTEVQKAIKFKMNNIFTFSYKDASSPFEANKDNVAHLRLFKPTAFSRDGLVVRLYMERFAQAGTNQDCSVWMYARLLKPYTQKH